MWFVPGFLIGYWWRQPQENVNCTVEQMDLVAQQHLLLSNIRLNPNPVTGINGLTVSEWKELYDIRTNYSEPYGYVAIAQCYDAIWAVALALDLARKEMESAGG